MSGIRTDIPSPLVGEGQGGGASVIRRAQRLRSNLTDVEKILWKHLRYKQFKNAKFRRQAPIGKYIVDFVSFERKLIIELDGGQHAIQQNYDARRDAWLRAEGFAILRFWNNDVTKNLEGVLQVIGEALPPTPALPHKGGGSRLAESAS